jgi:PAS domain S-box-containing protein
MKLGFAASGRISVEGRVFSARVVPENAGEQLLCFLREVTDQDVLLERLEAGERQYWRIINGIPLGVVIGELVTDARGKPLDYRIVAANAAFEDHTGVPASKILNRRIRQVFPGADESDIGVELFANVVVTGEPVEMCGFNKLVHRFIHFFVFCVQPGRFACIVNDLSEKKAVEDRLRMVENAVEASTDEIYFLNCSGYFIWGNGAVLERLGVGKSDLRNIHVSRLNPSVSQEWWDDFLSQLRSRRHFQIESVHRRTDGTVYPVELNSTLVRTDRSDIICTIARDTTLQTTELSALSRSRDHMETALEAAGLGFWTLSPLSGKFSSDRRWPAMTGQGGTPLTGNAEEFLFPAIHPTDRRRLRLELTSGPYQNGSVMCRLSSDESRWIRIIWRKVRSREGLRIVAVSWDATGERLLGLLSAGSDSPAMDALSGFLGVLRSRLGKVSAAAASDEPGTVKRLLSDLVSGVEALVPEWEGPGETIFLEPFLRELAPLIQGLLGEGGGFSLELAPASAVKGSQELLERFFLRLAGFAGRSFPGGARMKVSTVSGGGVSGCLRVNADLDVPGPQVSVDSGDPLLLEAFGAVRAMRGAVSGQHREGGIRVAVSLPSALFESTGRVLVASGDPVERRTLETVLKQMNLRTRSFETASEALEAMEPGDALVISSGLHDFPEDLPERTLVLGSGYQGPGDNLPSPWTITALKAAVRRALFRG